MRAGKKLPPLRDQPHNEEVRLGRSNGQSAAVGPALCIIADRKLRRRLRRSLMGAGHSEVEFCDTLADAQRLPSRPRLLFLDAHSRRDDALAHFLAQMDSEGQVVIIGDSIEDDDFVSTMRTLPIDSVLQADPDENELVATSVKLVSGDIFGLDKYLGWGSEQQTHLVRNYEEKRLAIMMISEFARSVGIRRRRLAQIASVTDELLMNAIYDAPEVAEGKRALEVGPILSQVRVKPDPATLSFGCDGRFLGLSVVDHYGELDKDSILDNLQRARERGGRPRQGTSGAGLGIFIVLSSVSRYVANIEPGVKTEVICLFDLRLSGRERPRCSQSLQIFRS